MATRKAAWNKGLKTPLSVRIKLSEAHKGHKFSDETKLKMSLARKGVPHSEEWKMKISKSHKGKVFSSETRKKMSASSKKRMRFPLSEKTKAKIGAANKIRMKAWAKKYPKELITRLLGNKPMSKLEMQFESIIKRNGLPYKFVGNGDFMIEQKCPDFINTNGQKIAIEVYYKNHKEKFKKEGFDLWKQERTNVFSRYGWTVLFFDASEIKKENQVVEKLKEVIL
ncbi:NUMOD3 motif (2 copies) [Candidatus Anstonella stagnisolia]|nr:NUMOD3 motif (2 copies) [Candidatus Anstonella stagnisolia]